jgi:hypothetical protein
VPKAIVRALDVSEVFQEALIAMEHPAVYGPVIALSALESYFDAAKRQQRRIERAKASIDKAFLRAPGVKRGTNLFYDVHFYLISWAQIAKLARFIQETTRFSRVGLVLRRFRPDLQDRIDARDHFEHFEERLPGGKNQNKLANPNDLRNMVNQYLTYGGRRLDIGPDSIRLLKTIQDEFCTAILFDSLEVLAKEDQSRLSFLFKRASTNVRDARMAKKVQRILQGGS